MKDILDYARELIRESNYEEVLCTRCSGTGTAPGESCLGKPSVEEQPCIACAGHGVNFAPRGTAMRRLRADQVIKKLGS